MVRRCRSGMRPDQPIPPFDPTPVTVTKPCPRIAQECTFFVIADLADEVIPRRS